MTQQMPHNVTLAKPSGITLAQHTADVVAEAACICHVMASSVAKYNMAIHKSLADRLHLVAEYHDNGKKCQKWQGACVKDYLAYQQWKSEHADADFNDYCKSAYNEAGRYLRKSGVRHEMYSLAEAAKTKMPLPLLAAIAAHHGKLSFAAEKRWDGFCGYWNLFKKQSNSITENCMLEDVCKYILEYDGLRGLLQLADHRASAKEEGDEVAELKSFAYTFPFAQKRGIQKLVEAEWEKDLLLVRAPTGAGKTDAALLWASRQIEACRADRMVIAMPTRFTANALAINVSESLSGTGLYHSSAWYAKYEDIKNGAISSQEALAAHKMARLLAAPVTVTTIDHLLMSLTQTREDQHLINFNLANSCVVIDEADFYDDFTLANIQFMLKVLKCWQVPVMVMSASIPDSALSFYQETGYSVESILEDSGIDKSVDKLEIKQICSYSDVDELAPLLRKCLERGHGIIYVNTVDKAIDVYNLLKSMEDDEGNDTPLILYHSRFTEPGKACKERQLLECLGKDAWRSGCAQGIAILTQIGEISINISSDIMISDACPIDRLMQRVGRLCRFDNSIGELYVTVPQRNDTLYPAPYGNICKKAWTSSEALQKTIDRLHTGVYSENDMLNTLNSVYASGIRVSDKAAANAKMLKEMFVGNWLINPMGKTMEEDSATDFWKSRDIGPQDIVFTESPVCRFFASYSDFMNFRLQASLALPMYLFSKIRNRVDIKTIYIADEEKKIYVIREGFYNNEIGFKVSEDKDEIFL